MNPLLTKEPFSLGLVLEIMPLGQKCWEENTILKGESCAFYGSREFKIEPYIPMYEGLAKANRLVILTLRDEGELVGYATGFSYISPHHGAAIAGSGDSIYLEPRYRTYGAVMVVRMMKELRELGAIIIGWPATPGGFLHDLLVSLNFVGDDVVMEKRLCA